MGKARRSMPIHTRDTLPLIAAHELSEQHLRKEYGFTVKGTHQRMRVTLNQLIKEEMVLLKSEQILSVIADAEVGSEEGKLLASQLKTRLELRQKNHEGMRDIAPQIQQAIPQLDQDFFAPEIKHLDALSKGNIEGLSREPLFEELARAQVNTRYGGDRRDESGRKVLALTNDGKEQMFQRFPLRTERDNALPAQVPIQRTSVSPKPSGAPDFAPSRQALAASQLDGFMQRMVRPVYSQITRDVPDVQLSGDKQYEATIVGRKHQGRDV